MDCPCCGKRVRRERVEDLVAAFLEEMRPELWVSTDVLEVKFLIFDASRRKLFRELLSGMVARGWLEVKIEAREAAKYRLVRPWTDFG